MARETRFTSYTSQRGVRISAVLTLPMVSGVPQTVVHEGVCVTQTTQPRGDVMRVDDVSE